MFILTHSDPCGNSSGFMACVVIGAHEPAFLQPYCEHLCPRNFGTYQYFSVILFTCWIEWSVVIHEYCRIGNFEYQQNMDTVKLEPDSDDETNAACIFVECQLIEQDPEQATLNKINSEYKEESCNVPVIKEIPAQAITESWDRVEQSVSEHEDGYMSNEFELCLVKQEGDVSGCANTSSKSTHNRRLRKNHDEKRFKCDVCNKLFTRKYHLKIHHRVHTGEKPFSCGVCNKHFSRNEYLALHRRTHTGEKPYKCELCNTGFSRNDVLAKHIRTHRIRSKPFTCGICQEAFSWKRALLRHKHIHNGGRRKVRDALLGTQA